MPLPPLHSPLTARLRSALTQALTARDLAAAAAICSALADIANAEAVPLPETSVPTTSEHFAGAVAGLGAAEAERRRLTEADIAAIVAAEIADRRSAADRCDGLGRAAQAARLRREADVLAALLDERPA
jgi:uncharacterized protein